MANWISSKLKVAESFLQQIDQQAAESLGKSEKPHNDDLSLDNPRKPGGGSVSLKDQLKKKAQETNGHHEKLQIDPNLRTLDNKEISASLSLEPSSNHRPSLSDSDWTELLNGPKSTTGTAALCSNGAPGIQNLNKDGRRRSNLILNSSTIETKRNQRHKIGRSNTGDRNKVKGNVLDDGLNHGKELNSSDSMYKIVNTELRKDVERNQLDQKVGTAKVMVEKKDGEYGGNNDLHYQEKINLKDDSHSKDETYSLASVSNVADKAFNLQMVVGNGNKSLERVAGEVNEDNIAAVSSTIDDIKRISSSVSTEGSDSDSTNSGSMYDSESEREMEERRRRREQILAEKAAAKAVEAIKERENMVARLEGEKQSLEKILDERAKQQAKEASVLQMTMTETMEAVDLEKEKHKNTRMGVLARLVKFETANADLARSLANIQRSLDVEVDRVSKLRQQIELKEMAHEELSRKISSANQSGKSNGQLIISKGVIVEREILEAEFSFTTDKIGRLQEKAKNLEANIQTTRKEIENPTEVEIELKKRLSMLTNHLIQKQTQVEALSSEKATQLFRIEALSRMVDENKTALDSRVDLESGAWESTGSNKTRSGRQRLGSLLRQVDAIFSGGAVLFRRNPTARWWAVAYFACLHFWVLYILMSHFQPSDNIRSGAVVSLESINKTAGT